jgi:hypothetical protein
MGSRGRRFSCPKLRQRFGQAAQLWNSVPGRSRSRSAGRYFIPMTAGGAHLAQVSGRAGVSPALPGVPPGRSRNRGRSSQCGAYFRFGDPAGRAGGRGRDARPTRDHLHPFGEALPPARPHAGGRGAAVAVTGAGRIGRCAEHPFGAGTDGRCWGPLLSRRSPSVAKRVQPHPPVGTFRQLSPKIGANLFDKSRNSKPVAVRRR